MIRATLRRTRIVGHAQPELVAGSGWASVVNKIDLCVGRLSSTARAVYTFAPLFVPRRASGAVFEAAFALFSPPQPGEQVLAQVSLVVGPAEGFKGASYVERVDLATPGVEGWAQDLRAEDLLAARALSLALVIECDRPVIYQAAAVTFTR